MNPWLFLPVGYVLSVLCETPILYVGLSRHYTNRERLFAGAWLTACTYPIVILVIPMLTGRFYLPIAETFAPLAECLLFVWSFKKTWRARDMAAIVAANLCSFGVGMVLFR
jgi:hypothetical protein